MCVMRYTANWQLFCLSILVQLIREHEFILKQIVIIAVFRTHLSVKTSRDADRQIRDVSEQTGNV